VPLKTPKPVTNFKSPKILYTGDLLIVQFPGMNFYYRRFQVFYFIFSKALAIGPLETFLIFEKLFVCHLSRDTNAW